MNSITEKLKKLATPKGLAITGIGFVGAKVLTPFVEELLGGEAAVASLSDSDVENAASGGSLKTALLHMAIGCACRKSAAAVIEHAPKLMSEWGDEIMKHGGAMLSRLSEPLKDTAANALDVAKDALGLGDAAELAAEGAGAAADEFAASIAEEPLFTAVEAGMDTAGDALGDAAGDFLGRCAETLGGIIFG